MSVIDGSSTMPVIDGFRTMRVDTLDKQYQADDKYAPDKAGLWKTPESHDGWMRAHNAIRYEIGEMKKVVTALEYTTLEQWQLDAVKAWWDGHKTHVHEHHSNEDDFMNPVLRARIVYPAKLEADHEQLIKAMDAIAEYVRSIEIGDTLAGLKPLWAHYEGLMLPHLYEEEQIGLPLARAYFTPAEIDKVTSQFLKNADPRSLGSFVHTLGHKKDAMQFMRENGIPFFVWHLPGKGFKALRTTYRMRMQSHIDSLLVGEPVSAKSKRQAKENAEKAAKRVTAAPKALSPSKLVQAGR